MSEEKPSIGSVDFSNISCSPDDTVHMRGKTKAPDKQELTGSRISAPHPCAQRLVQYSYTTYHERKISHPPTRL